MRHLSKIPVDLAHLLKEATLLPNSFSGLQIQLDSSLNLLLKQVFTSAADAPKPLIYSSSATFWKLNDWLRTEELGLSCRRPLAKLVQVQARLSASCFKFPSQYYTWHQPAQRNLCFHSLFSKLSCLSVVLSLAWEGRAYWVFEEYGGLLHLVAQARSLYVRVALAKIWPK